MTRPPSPEPHHARPDAVADRLETAKHLFETGKAEEGMRLLQAALMADHRHVPTLVAYAQAQREYGTYALAEEACRVALEIAPDDADALLMLARILHETGRMEAALETTQDALSLRPDHEQARIFEAVLFKAAGRFDDARRVLQELVRDHPRALAAYPVLADIETFSPDHPILNQMLALAAEAWDPPPLPALYYAIGKALDDIGDHEAAFAHFALGARLKRARVHYDEPDALAFFDEIMTVFDQPFIERRRLTTAPSGIVPVFIVGMPRSGSTLIERIIASHPEAGSEGEMKSFLECLAGVQLPEEGGPSFPQIVPQMSDEQLALLSRLHAFHVRDQAGGARVFINKLLGHIFFVGLIHIVLPEAKFIVAKRDPVDTCLSAFTTLFGENLPHTYDLAELGRYYCKYEELMRHWQKVLPQGTIREVQYEDVVADLSGQARNLIQFVGLPWNEACLAFHESRLPVRTASASQVRRPLYRRSVGRWRRYERQLEPLIHALGGRPE